MKILEKIDEELLNAVKEKSKYLFEQFDGADGILSVSGMGLMLGIETEKPAGDIAKECLSKGLLVLTAKTKVRLLPPLNITKDELNRGLKILKEVIEG